MPENRRQVSSLRPAAFRLPSMRNIALLIEYDGTAYGGWQVQKNSNSIQAVLQDTLSELLQEKIKVIGAGRTDAGAHAYGQVANFHASTEWEVAKIVYALNGNLPVDIGVRGAANVPDSFHSRFDAVARKYLYRIITWKSPIMRHCAAFLPYEFSIEKMNEASALIMGEKSFKSFTKYADQSTGSRSSSGQRRFICKIASAVWTRSWKTSDSASGEEVIFRIEANRFLHGMVRALVGTMVDVGRGKISVDQFQQIMKSGKRSLASMSAPASGLFLQEVKYRFDIWREIGQWSSGAME